MLDLESKNKYKINIYMNIEEFDYNDIPTYATITIIASRRSGKSVITRDLLYKEFIRRRKLKNIYVVSPTIHNGDYSFLNDTYKYTEFDEEFLDKILKRQEQLIVSDPKGDHDSIIILDDIVKSTDQKTKDILSRLFTLSRHYRLYIVLISQSLRHELTPIIKFNSDIVIIFKTRNFDNKKEISDLWLGFSDKDQRQESFRLIDEVAKGYRALVINNTIHSDSVEDIVFYKQVDIEHSVPKRFFLN